MTMALFHVAYAKKVPYDKLVSFMGAIFRDGWIYFIGQPTTHTGLFSTFCVVNLAYW